MNEIEEFYRHNGTPDFLIKQRMKLFSDNKDIAEEFLYWIKNRKYKTKNPLEVEGYTAEKISELSKYMDGDGAFMMLIELRNDPVHAKRKISDGFKVK